MFKVYENMKEDGDDRSMKGDIHVSGVDLSLGGTRAVIEFTAAQSAVLENEKRVRVGIRRGGRINNRVIFRYLTVNTVKKR